MEFVLLFQIQDELDYIPLFGVMTMTLIMWPHAHWGVLLDPIM